MHDDDMSPPAPADTHVESMFDGFHREASSLFGWAVYGAALVLIVGWVLVANLIRLVARQNLGAAALEALAVTAGLAAWAAKRAAWWAIPKLRDLFYDFDDADWED